MFFRRRKSFKCFRRAKPEHEWLSSVFKSCRRIPSVPETLKIVEFFWALIKEFYQIVVPSDEYLTEVPEFSFAWSSINSLDRKLNSWNWRNGRLKERLHRTQVWLTFLTFSSDHCSFKLILPNNESDRSFLKATACVQVRLVDAQLIKRRGKENETHKPAIE